MPDALAQEIQTDAAVVRRVERALADLRRGEPVLLHEPGAAALVLAAEQPGEEALARLRALSGGEGLLLLTARRAVALGMDTLGEGTTSGDTVAIEAAGVSARGIIELADPTNSRHPRPIEPPRLAQAPGGLGPVAVDLVKLARLLPAAVLAPLSPQDEDPAQWAAARDLLSLSANDTCEYRFAGARSLTRVAEAHLPLAGAETTRVISFRPGDGGKEHLALVIGEPRPGESLLLRLHSECLTGDLLGSLRCDCGDQLRGALDAIAAAGAGVLLYLSQEGRGIGLVNKLRAYQLQDRGADTAEANEQLGFDADERLYLPAANMLRQLGFHRVRLLTNNPAKVAGLIHCGITVEERVPHAFPSNGHNDFYLATKAARFGHQF
ncbi:MAG: GTP cyclohydrolase II [Kiloniellales bacterium]